MLLLAGCSSGGTPPVSERSRVDDSTERRAARAARLCSWLTARERVTDMIVCPRSSTATSVIDMATTSSSSVRPQRL